MFSPASQGGLQVLAGRGRQGSNYHLLPGPTLGTEGTPLRMAVVMDQGVCGESCKDTDSRNSRHDLHSESLKHWMGSVGMIPAGGKSGVCMLDAKEPILSGECWVT